MIAERDELMSHARRKKGMTKEAAQQWTYEELERRYPPLAKTTEPETGAENPRKKALERLTTYTETKTTTNNTQEETAAIAEESAADVGTPAGEGKRAKSSRRTTTADVADKLVLGIDRIPRSWPPLPPNASLAEEIRWVQANRIDIVQERSNGSVIVRLNRATAPAPSKAALGWLETSIRAYSKYCDIAAKAATSYQDEAEVERQERMSIDRIRQLLGQMMESSGK